MTQNKSSSKDDIPPTSTLNFDTDLEEISRVLRLLNKIKERVAYLLLAFPETKNSDGLLESLYFGLFHNIASFRSLTPREIRIFDSNDTVRRMRQELQREDPSKYGPTDPEVVKKRRLKRRAVESVIER